MASEVLEVNSQKQWRVAIGTGIYRDTGVNPVHGIILGFRYVWKNTGIMLGTYFFTLNNFQSYRNCEGLPRLESDCCESGVSRIWSCKSGVPRIWNYINLCIAVPKFSFRIAISSRCSCSMINKC